MQTAIVLGSARATVKHASLIGRRLVVVQPLMLDATADGPPLLAIDDLGCRRGDRVIVNSDGPYLRQLLGDRTTPARWSVMGMVDPQQPDLQTSDRPESPAPLDA
jgi:ethanolamine utilization protein EutN